MTIKFGGIRDAWNVPMETTEMKVKLDNEVKQKSGDKVLYYIMEILEIVLLTNIVIMLL